MFRLPAIILAGLLLQACYTIYGPLDTELKRAVQTGDLATVEARLRAGVDPNIPGPSYGDNNRTIMHFAASAGTNNPGEMIELLLAHGGDPNVKTPHLKHTPLHYAGTPEAVHTLMAAGAQLNVRAKDPTRSTPLMMAATSTNGIDRAKALLSYGIDRDQILKAADTAYERVMLRGQILGKHGVADPKAENLGSVAKLHAEAFHAHRAMVDFLAVQVMSEQELAGRYPEISPAMYQSAPAAPTQMVRSSGNVPHRVVPGNGGRYMCPWTSDGVLAPWVDKAINAKMGAAAGSAIGGFLGAQATDNMALVGGLLGAKAGQVSGRALAIKASGGDAYIRDTSDLSFNSLSDMARYVRDKHGNSAHFADAVKAANEIYPGFLKQVRQSR